MTKKRFEIKIGDCEEENIVDNLNRSTIHEISDMCKKMNELSEENHDNKAMIEFLDTENTQIMNELKTRTQIQHQLEEENEQLKEEIARQKFSKKIMRGNIKDYERAIKGLRKSYEKFDEMRLERIRFLEKRLKKNGLSIYVNDCGNLE